MSTSPKGSDPSNSIADYWAEFTGVFRRFQEVWSVLGKREKMLLRLSLLPMIFHSVSQNSISVLAGKMVDRLQTSQQAGTIRADWWSIAIFFVVAIALLALVRELLFLVRKRMVGNVSSRVERSLTIGLVSHMFRQSLQSLSKDHVGTVHSRATQGISSFIRFIKIIFREFLPAVFAISVALGYAFYKNPIIGVLLLVALISSLALIAIQLRSQKGMYSELGKSRGELDGKIIEQLEGMEYIRAANTLGLEVDRVRKYAEERHQCDTRLAIRSVTFDLFKSLNEWFFYMAVLLLTIYLAVIGKIEVGDIIAFLGLAANMTAPLRDMHRIMDEGYETSLQLKDLMGIMNELLDPSFVVDMETEPTMLQRFIEIRPAPPIKVEFQEPQLVPGVPLFSAKDLTVDYGSGKSYRRVLNGVTVEIGQGETIGFAGPSGSGKSTLLKVLMRLIAPATGEAKLGGVPIKNVSRDAIGRLVGYVSQNPFVFSGTVAQNIAYGCGEVSQEAIEAAAKKAGIHEDILAMAGGYDASLHERGSNISGGQRQRIAIARIFLKDPPILILDEGTSALDNVSEQKVQESLELFRGSRTILMVAHRLTTLRSADRILVFERGRIVQSGTMDELSNTDGVFRDLMKVVEAE